ncbi:MAG: hypothetical protein H6760_00500 [Candidatus Nomurabacteria bacterium]|nr:MAG: hypothetical protein H6760_00500 [Candidatus Nomurabacteria bacterium]
MTKNNNDDRLLALASYVWILSVLILLLKKDSDFVRFHARQGFVLFIISVICSILAIFWWVNLIVAVMALIGMYKAYQGEKWKMPLVGMLAEKINF